MKKAVKKAVETKPRAKKTGYTASIYLKSLGQTYTAKGGSAREAIENLKAKNTKGIGILTISNGQIKKDKIVPAPLTFRLFSESKLAREIALKNVAMLFDF